MIFFFKLCVVVVGLILPGIMLARTLRLEHAWAAGFPLSALFLVETTILFSLTGMPICFSTMTGALIIWVLLCQIINMRQSANPPGPSCAESANLSAYQMAAILAFTCSILIAVTLRTTLFPLRGPDTSFRWEGLALAMLQHQSLDFYPPVSAGDYAIYLYPDGIPPLVATVYWWIYVTIGLPLPQVTSISVVLQLAATMALTFYGARHAFGSRAAWYALLAIGASPLLISGFAIGQETGFTALSVAGQLCFAWAAVRNPKRSTAIVAALFAALGALTRDYGPALALAGGSVLLWHRETRRFLPLFILTVTLLAAPWYIRSWVLTGNPFFSHRLPGGFNVNAVHAAIMDHYQVLYAFATFSPERWLMLVKQLVTGGFLAIGIGLPYALVRWRELTPLVITALLVILLWIYSVGQTAGGVVYSTRVLTPAILAMAIAAGVALSRLDGIGKSGEGRGFLVYGTRILLILLCGYTLVSMAIYPSRSQYFFTVPAGAASGSFQQVVVDNLEATNLPATGVLTDMTFLAESMKRTSRFRPVMHWNPEVQFIFEQNLDTKEIHRRLVEKNIKLILVDYKSPNNRFLSQFKFFRESSGWKLLYKMENEFAVYYH